MYGPSVGVAALPLPAAAAPVLAEGLSDDHSGDWHRDRKENGEKFSPDN